MIKCEYSNPMIYYEEVHKTRFIISPNQMLVIALHGGARFPTEIGTQIKLGARKTKTKVPTTDDPWNDQRSLERPKL